MGVPRFPSRERKEPRSFLGWRRWDSPAVLLPEATQLALWLSRPCPTPF